MRETFGALVAGHQARTAEDPAVRRVMRCIARDELRHAALAWRVARWAERRLSAAARARVSLARTETRRALFDDLVGDTPPELARVAGLPSGGELRRMARELDRELWA